MSGIRTHYDNLKVARDAPDFVIRAAYKTLSQKFHPDKNPDDERAVRVMSVINASFGVLSDPEKRRQHDAWIAREELKLKQASQPQTPPIPPQWRQEEPVPEPQNERRNLLVGLLLLPFKIIWGIFRAVPQLALLALLIGGFWIWDEVTPDRPPPPGPKPYQAVAPVEAVSEPDPVPEEPAYERPAVAPNGSPWPTRPAYVADYPLDNNDGHSDVTVDNTQNDSDVFVKLVSLDGTTAYPVRQFFIPAGMKFTMDSVTAGHYDIRYRDLQTGGLARSESFDVEEERTYEGIRYSSLTMTLYKVEGGNFQTYDLAEAEF